MGRRRVLSLLLLCLTWVTVQSVLYELKGGQALLGPDTLSQPPDSILWKCNGNKVVEFTGSEQRGYGSYEGRVTLNWHTAQLHISDLRLEDSGSYEYEIVTPGKVLQSSYELEVIDRVAKPAITCEINDSSPSLSAVLLCSVDQPRPPLMFQWSQEANVQPGKTLTISLGAELDEQQYTCQVSNPVSQETATFTAKDCYTDTGLSIGMVVVIVLIILMICVALLTLVYLLKRKDLACFKKGPPHDLEKPSPKGPHKKSVEENRTTAFERETTLPSSRQLASYQDLHEEPRRDEEKKPLLREHDVELQQWPPTGSVREKVKKIEQRMDSNLILPKKTGLEQKLGEENANSKSDSTLSPQENHGTLEQSNNEQQTSATTEQGGSETKEGGQEPNASQKVTHESNEENQQKSDFLSQENTDKSEEAQNKNDHDESENENEATKNIPMVKKEEASIDINNHSETSAHGRGPNLSQADATIAEDNQQKTNGTDSADENKVMKDGDVVGEVEASSGMDKPAKEEDPSHCKQNDENTQPPVTTEQISSEPAAGGKDSNLPLAEATTSADNPAGEEPAPLTQNSANLPAQDADVGHDKELNAERQQPTKNEHGGSDISEGGKEQKEQKSEADPYETAGEESASEDEATKNVNVVKEAEASSDLNSASEIDKLGDSTKNDDTQLQNTTEQLGSGTPGGVKDPNLSEIEAAKMGYSQQSIDNEPLAKKNDHVLEGAKASCDPDNSGEKDKLADSNQNDDKHTQLQAQGNEDVDDSEHEKGHS